MRRLLTGLLVAAVTAMVPISGMAGNQEVAEQIAKSLRTSGQLRDYKIGVKYQDGIAWLKGQVTSDEQAKAALALAAQTQGVRQVKNELSVVAPSEPATAGRLQTAEGVFAPEQTSRVVPASAGSYTTTALPASAMRQSPQAQQSAQPVPTSFTQVPARPAMALDNESSEPMPYQMQRPMPAKQLRPIPIAYTQAPANPAMPAEIGPTSAMPMGMGGPIPAHVAPIGGGVAPARYDQPNMPCYAWPSYASYPNYAAVTYPRQHSPTAWPYIGPFYPYPQVPLGWRKVTLEWDDGWWMLDFKD